LFKLVFQPGQVGIPAMLSCLTGHPASFSAPNLPTDRPDQAGKSTKTNRLAKLG